MIVVDNSKNSDKFESFFGLLGESETISLFKMDSVELEVILDKKQSVVVIDDVESFNPAVTKKWLRDKTGNDEVYAQHQLSFVLIADHPVEFLKLRRDDDELESYTGYNSYFFIVSPYLKGRIDGENQRMENDGFIQYVVSVILIAGSDHNKNIKINKDLFYVLTVAGVFVPINNFIAGCKTETIKKILLKREISADSPNLYDKYRSVYTACKREIERKYFQKFIPGNSLENYDRVDINNYIVKFQKEKWDGRIITEGMKEFNDRVKRSGQEPGLFYTLGERITQVVSIKTGFTPDYTPLIYDYNQKANESVSDLKKDLDYFDSNTFQPFAKNKYRLLLQLGGWILGILAIFLFIMRWPLFFLLITVGGAGFFLFKLFLLIRQFKRQYDEFKSELGKKMDQISDLFKSSDLAWLNLQVISEMEKHIEILENRKKQTLDYFRNITALKALDLNNDQWHEVTLELTHRIKDLPAELIDQVMLHDDIKIVLEGIDKKINDLINNKYADNENQWWSISYFELKRILLTQKEQALRLERQVHVPSDENSREFDDSIGEYCCWLPERLISFDFGINNRYALSSNKMALIAWVRSFGKIDKKADDEI